MLRALARSLTHSIGPYKGIVRKSIDRSIGPYKSIVLKSIDRKSIFIPTCLALLKPMLDLSAEALMLATECTYVTIYVVFRYCIISSTAKGIQHIAQIVYHMTSSHTCIKHLILEDTFCDNANTLQLHTPPRLGADALVLDCCAKILS